MANTSFIPHSGSDNIRAGEAESESESESE